MPFSQYGGVVTINGEFVDHWYVQSKYSLLNLYVKPGSNMPVRMVNAVDNNGEKSTFIMEFYSWTSGAPHPSMFNVPPYCPNGPQLGGKHALTKKSAEAAEQTVRTAVKDLRALSRSIQEATQSQQ